MTSPAFIWILVAFIGATWLIFAPIRFGVQYIHHDDRDMLRISLVISPLPRFVVTIPFQRTVRWSKQIKRRMLKMPDFVKSVVGKRMRRSVIRLLTHRTPRALRVVEQLDWKTVIGADDAAITSLAAGGLWFAKSTIVAELAKALTFVHTPNLEVIPSYKRACLNTEVACIFRFTIGEIIIAALPWSTQSSRG